MAQRAGISRSSLYKVEAGDPGGLAFALSLGAGLLVFVIDKTHK